MNFSQTTVPTQPICIVIMLLILLVSCPIEGQFYTADCFGTNATCSNPNPPALCDYPQCVCPQGQVIDTNAKACINGTDCSKFF